MYVMGVGGAECSDVMWDGARVMLRDERVIWSDLE